MAGESKLAIFAAAGANLLIAASKLAAAIYTGSSSMLTEAVHSFVDTGNEGLLWLGVSRGSRPADASHPFGYGLEVYFWSFIVAIMIFSIGGAASIYEGGRKLLSPEPIHQAWVNFAVFGAAFVFESISLAVGYRQLRAANPRRGILEAIRRSKDPSLFSVILEDSAALAGLALAAAGVGASSLLGWTWADGAGSIGVGLVLVATAIFLANETRSLLTGEAAGTDLQATVRRRLSTLPEVRSLGAIKTLQLGPGKVLVAVTLDLEAGDSERTNQVARRVISELKRSDDRIAQVFLQPTESATEAPSASDMSQSQTAKGRIA